MALSSEHVVACQHGGIDTRGAAMTADPQLHTAPGGEPRRRRVGALTLIKASVSEQDNNAYLLVDVGGDALLVDAADDADALLRLVRRDDVGRLRGVVTTHRHWDHHRALGDVVTATGAPVLAGTDDADALPVPVDRRLDHGDVVEVGSLRLSVVGLRGHTPGSIALACVQPGQPAQLITGDSLFPGGVGKTGSPADFRSLLDDVETRLFDVYGDDAAVHPGHGDSTTVGDERPHLSTWRERGW
jgi:glyoxylase-like metal-dependent hydrolase (beta-lactamase superfamily II)